MSSLLACITLALQTINSFESMNTKPILLTVTGARPQFIKSAAVTRELASSGWRQWLVHAGQHMDDGMGLDFLSELEVPMPDARLYPSQSGRTPRLADMMVGLTKQMDEVKPHAVMVYGDTDATLAGALAAHHAQLPLIHVEAGLRSGDRGMPEEHNRILTDQLSDLLCTTGPRATAQLIREGVDPSRLTEVGDVMLDVALAAGNLAKARLPKGWPEPPSLVLVVTLHRPATADDPVKLKGALDAIELWAKRTGGTVYFPVHPRTKGCLERYGLQLPNCVIDPGPIGYLDMQSALHHADCVLTDSGGVQKEAWFQGSPAVILRNTTEWTELLEIEASELFDPDLLVDSSGVQALAGRLQLKRSVPSVVGSGLFGEGLAAQRILSALDRFLG